MVRKVEVFPYKAEWADRFIFEKEQIMEKAAPYVLKLHHIGSTSVPGLAAKPIIDILAEANSLEVFDFITPVLEGLGYEARGENGIPKRRYFVKFSSEGDRLVHLHAFQTGNPEVKRHLVFRDYLRKYPEQAAKYGQIKLEAAEKFPMDMESYIAYKDPFIKELEQLALKWNLEERSNLLK